MDIITSTQNSRIKEILKLEKHKIRQEKEIFLIEGFREISRAYDSGYEFEDILYCPEIKSFHFNELVNKFPAKQKIQVSSNVFSRIAYRDNHDGILATAKMKDHNLHGLIPSKNSLYLVLERVEKPGNLGALLRTADAAGVDAVFVCDSQTDIYNPNVVRSSIGCLFTNQVIQSTSEEAVHFFKSNNIKIYSAALQNSKLYYDVDFRHSTAIILGSEAYGLTKIWRENSDQIIMVPMSGIADSLNVSVTAAVLVFEAVRQRKY